MNKTRLEAFSDGVIAIIITIMVLELKVPHGTELATLMPLLPVFLSYVLSFIYLAIYWNNHHHMLHTSHKVTGPILWANLHLLFWLSLIPFTTVDGRESFRRVADGALRRRSSDGGDRLLHPPDHDHRVPGEGFASPPRGWPQGLERLAITDLLCGRNPDRLQFALGFKSDLPHCCTHVARARSQDRTGAGPIGGLMSHSCRTLVLLAACLIVATPAAAETFRCGQWIASPDMSVEELLEKCGAPTSKTVEVIDVYGPSDAGKGKIKRGTITVETWNYDRGSQSFAMVVKIEDGKIKSMGRAE
jgi:transmembrane protein TMEM174 (potassium channel)/uncharacterized protein DUF2845